jgi:hypothetical protein
VVWCSGLSVAPEPRSRCTVETKPALRPAKVSSWWREETVVLFPSVP